LSNYVHIELQAQRSDFIALVWLQVRGKLSELEDLEQSDLVRTSDCLSINTLPVEYPTMQRRAGGESSPSEPLFHEGNWLHKWEAGKSPIITKLTKGHSRDR
jgi:hypothetical protein